MQSLKMQRSRLVYSGAGSDPLPLPLLFENTIFSQRIHRLRRSYSPKLTIPAQISLPTRCSVMYGSSPEDYDLSKSTTCFNSIAISHSHSWVSEQAELIRRRDCHPANPRHPYIPGAGKPFGPVSQPIPCADQYIEPSYSSTRLDPLGILS